MYIVIYEFKVKEAHTAQFLEAWSKLTQLIYEYEGSLGSRLHYEDETSYIAYAQWPSKVVFENSGDNLPESATFWRQQMRTSCIEIKRLHEVKLVEDMTRSKVFQK